MSDQRSSMSPTSAPPRSSSEVGFGSGLPAPRVTLLRPALLVPLAVGVGGTAILLVTSHWILGLTGVLLGFGAAGLLLLTRALAQKSLEITAGSASAEDGRLRELSKRLAQLTYQASTQKQAERAVTQLDALKARWKSLGLILGEKFNPTEVTYDRYFSTASSVRLAILKNLETIGQILVGMGETSNSPVTARVEEILGFNAAALQELESVAVALAQVQTSREGLVPMEHLLEDLRSLAERAKKYESL
jgi:hypothetical protein